LRTAQRSHGANAVIAEESGHSGYWRGAVNIHLLLFAIALEFGFSFSTSSKSQRSIKPSITPYISLSKAE